MTSFQLIAIALLVATAAWTYLPTFSLKLPSLKRQPNNLKQIAQVMEIKDSSTDPKVVKACQDLLQALIG